MIMEGFSNLSVNDTAGIPAWRVSREPTLLRKQIPTRTFPLKPLYPGNTIKRCLENALIQINAKQFSFSLQISVRNAHSPQFLNFYGFDLGLAHSTGVYPSFSWLPLGRGMELCRSNLCPGILQEKSSSDSRSFPPQFPTLPVLPVCAPALGNGTKFDFSCENSITGILSVSGLSSRRSEQWEGETRTPSQRGWLVPFVVWLSCWCPPALPREGYPCSSTGSLRFGMLESFPFPNLQSTGETTLSKAGESPGLAELSAVKHHQNSSAPACNNNLMHPRNYLLERCILPLLIEEQALEINR